MPTIPSSLASLLVVLASVSASHADEFDFLFRSNGESFGEAILKLDRDSAEVTIGDEVEQFDLKQMRWRKPDGSAWVTLAECERWAEQSKEKSAESIAAKPELVRALMTWSLAPTFKTERNGDDLRLISGQADYALTGKVAATDELRNAYFRYMTLNAYKKAMTDRKLPPFAELKSIEAMKSLGHIPHKIAVTLSGIPNGPTIEIECVRREP